MKTAILMISILAAAEAHAQSSQTLPEGKNTVETGTKSTEPVVTLTQRELSALVQAEIAKAIIQRETQAVYDKVDEAFQRQKN